MQYSFSLWQTKSETVNLVLFDSIESCRNNQVADILPMHSDGKGAFSLQAEVQLGQLYLFELADGKLYPDPRSQSQPLGVHGATQILPPDSFAWTDSSWKGVELKDLILYELHVGTFNVPADSPQNYGRFTDIIPKLDYLKRLGVTAIELMPVSEAPGKNWGYDGVYLFAVSQLYGGAEELKNLVNAAHEKGLAVVMDVVYNHFGPEGCYLGALGEYYDSRFSNPWGQAVNFSGSHSDPVRQFVTDNARYWIERFHLDGLRLDATDTIIDLSGRHILSDIALTVKQAGKAASRTTFTIAEDDDNHAVKLIPAVQNGFGLDGVWNIDFHHALYAVLSKERTGLYADYAASSEFSTPEEALCKAFTDGWVYDGQYRNRYEKSWGTSFNSLNPIQLIVYNQTHDQVGNAVESKRLTELFSPAAARLSAAITLMSPFTPLLFMGEEYGETQPFPFFTSFDNPALKKAVRRGRQRDMEYMHQRKLPPVADPFADSTIENAGLKWASPCFDSRLSLYQDLIQLRKQTHIAGMSFKRFTQSNAAGLIYLDCQPKILTWRWTVKNENREQTYITAANLTSQTLLPPEWELEGMAFSSEENKYGGQRNEQTGNRLLPYEFILMHCQSSS